MISKVQESADVPVLIVLERQDPTIKTEEKREVDVLVVTQRQRLIVQRKVEIPLAEFIDEIVDGVKRVPHERVSEQIGDLFIDHKVHRLRLRRKSFIQFMTSRTRGFRTEGENARRRQQCQE